MGLRSNFLRLMDQYGDVFDLVFKTKDFKNSFSDLIRKDIPECIKREISLPDDIYKIKEIRYKKGLMNYEDYKIPTIMFIN